MYEEGKGVEQSDVKAFHYYKLAADMGLPLAQVQVGLCYMDGQGVVTDYKQALCYFTLAIDQGMEEAQGPLALLYQNGWGVEKNHVKAIYLFRQSMKSNLNEEFHKNAKETIEEMRDSVKTFCWSCKKNDKGIKLTQCSQCYSVWYCSKECQAKDWKEGKHKIDCKKV